MCGDRARSFLVLRLAVGIIFLSEGIQKFLFPDELGIGRFAKIGIPGSQCARSIRGHRGDLGGSLLTVGLLTRLVCLPMLFSMLVAITTTKLLNPRESRLLEDHARGSNGSPHDCRLAVHAV